MDNRTEYYLLLADLVDSSDMDPDTANQAFSVLSDSLDRANEVFVRELAAPFEINYGDEFAALFTRPQHIYDCVDALRQTLHGLAAFRFAVVRGRINYAGGTIRQMGGPVFQDASSVLDKLKRSGRFAHWMIGTPLENATLNSLSNMIDVLIAAMTDYQYDIYLHLREGRSQVDIAQRLGKYEQSISRAIQSSHAGLIIDAETTLNARLREHSRAAAEMASSL